MELVSETIPAGTTMTPGEKFEKSWTIRNTGTCEWSREFDVYLSGGEAYGSNKYGDFKENVPLERRQQSRFMIWWHHKHQEPITVIGL